MENPQLRTLSLHPGASTSNVEPGEMVFAQRYPSQKSLPPVDTKNFGQREFFPLSRDSFKDVVVLGS